MLTNILYIVGVVLVLIALAAFLGLIAFAWQTPLVVGVILIVVAYLLGRRTVGRGAAL